MLRKLIVLLGLGLWLSGCYTARFYIVRHAERADNSQDSPLSAAGHQRARVLADLLAPKQIDSLFATSYIRTQQTAAPLAQRLNKTVAIYSPHLTNVIVNRLNRIKSKNALVVEHSDTILDIVKGLGANPTKTSIAPGEFNNLFVVTVRKRPFARSVDVSETTYDGSSTP